MSDLLSVLQDDEVEEMKRRIGGVAPAIVTDNEDPEGLGRIRVMYPWMAGNQQSYWARVARPFAGSARGDWNPPQINDEVLVCFELGHIDKPYIVGVLWNGVDTPPETSTKKHVRQTAKGYRWEIDETDGQEKVSFLAAAWRYVLNLVSNILTFTVGGLTKIQDSGGNNYVELDPESGMIKTRAASIWRDDSAAIDLAGGGPAVARVGDQVEVSGVTSDGATFTAIGTIISGSSKVTAG